MNKNTYNNKMLSIIYDNDFLQEFNEEKYNSNDIDIIEKDTPLIQLFFTKFKNLQELKSFVNLHSEFEKDYDKALHFTVFNYINVSILDYIEDQIIIEKDNKFEINW